MREKQRVLRGIVLTHEIETDRQKISAQAQQTLKKNENNHSDQFQYFRKIQCARVLGNPKLHASPRVEPAQSYLLIRVGRCYFC